MRQQQQESTCKRRDRESLAGLKGCLSQQGGEGWAHTYFQGPTLKGHFCLACGSHQGGRISELLCRLETDSHGRFWLSGRMLSPKGGISGHKGDVDLVHISQRVGVGLEACPAGCTAEPAAPHRFRLRRENLSGTHWK